MTQSFSCFGFPSRLLEALTRMRFDAPTPIQSATIPHVLDGHDVLGSAQTGTGKTGAFAIPIIAKLMEEPDKMALIMTPTRELGTQVLNNIKQMIAVPNLKTALLIGGEPMPKQFAQLRQKPRIIVGTPGRINDHLDRGTLRLDRVGYVVLDETDRMLDLGFDVQIESIIEQIQEEHQTLMFSATIAPNIVRLSSQYLKNPKRVSVGSTTAAAPNIQQEMIKTSSSQKHGHLLKQLEQNAGSTIIFVKTKRDTERLADRLKESGFLSEALHGDLKQTKRDRVVRSFRAQKFDVLVATDVAARGLDVPHIALVVNYDLPQVPEDYIHRIGRTARAGASGRAVNLVTSEDGAKWRAITRLMDPKSKPSEDVDFAPRPARRKERLQKDSWKKGWKSEKASMPFNKERKSRDGRRDNTYEADFGDWRANTKRENQSSHRDRFDDARPSFGRKQEGGRGRDRFDEARPSFGRKQEGGRGRDRFDDARPSFERKQEGGKGRDRFDDARPSFERKGSNFKSASRFKDDQGSRRGASHAKGQASSDRGSSWLDTIFENDQGTSNTSGKRFKKEQSRSVSKARTGGVEAASKKKTKTVKKQKRKVNQLNFES
ncbi:MAG: DEAD/DEAH box helicase [Candidatus Nucleicultricaceae bacterium]